MPTFNCCFNRHALGLHYTRTKLVHIQDVVLRCFYCCNNSFFFFFDDWCECVGERAPHDDIFLVHVTWQ